MNGRENCYLAIVAKRLSIVLKDQGSNPSTPFPNHGSTSRYIYRERDRKDLVLGGLLATNWEMFWRQKFVAKGQVHIWMVRTRIGPYIYMFNGRACT